MDKYDIPFLIKDIDNEMPTHTPRTCKIPIGNTLSLPKNLMEKSNKVHSKFLDSYLSDVEEFEMKNLLSDNFKTWFGKQNEYHIKQSKNKDGFLKKIKNYIDMDMKSCTLACGFIMNPSRFGGAVNGADLVSGDTSTTSNFGTGKVWGAQLATGTVTELYDRVAININSHDAGSTMNLGVYDDSGGNPYNLYGSSGSHSTVNGFNLKSVTEFELSTTANWTAMIKNNVIVEQYNNAAGARKRDTNTTSNSLPDPYTNDSTDTGELNTKITHS